MKLNKAFVLAVNLSLALSACKADNNSSAKSAQSDAASTQSADQAACALFDATCIKNEVERGLAIALNASNAYSLDKDNTLPSANIDQRLTPGGSALPEGLQGIWWMDGNPLHDLSFTLDGSPVTAENQVNVEVARNGIWAWYGDDAGELLFKFCQGLNLHYELTLKKGSDNQMHGVIIPIIQLGLVKDIRVPTWVASFTMEPTPGDSDTWVRHSSFFGKEILIYQLRRIVNADKSHTHNWDAFAAYAQKVPGYWLSKK